MQRKAFAVWQGGLKDGKGTLTTESKALSGTPYSFGTRFEGAPGHRRGHAMVWVGDDLLHGADVIHAVEHIAEPTWDAFYDSDVPLALVTRLARTKAEEARDLIANDKDIADAYVLAADTIVAVGRRILVKPRFIEEAVAALQLLSGRSHRVLTALCLIAPDDRVRLKIVDTRVRFKRLSKEEIEAYIASREWRGKAGGYAIQGLAGCFVQKLSGSYTNVVGLPLTEVVNMLVGEGFPIHFNWLKAGEAVMIQGASSGVGLMGLPDGATSDEDPI